ncbi:hypothetical protein Barb7_03081 [Bacteroidales bacterium Barb7]|nr:hypothetical protein Barb7_03081 [Bacteroidales bacterium Barb7]
MCKFFDIVQELVHVFLFTDAFYRTVLHQQAVDAALSHGEVSRFFGRTFDGESNEGGYQFAEIDQLLKCAGVDGQPIVCRLLQNCPEADGVADSGFGQLADGCVAYAARGVVDDPLQGFLIVRIDNQAEIGNHVLYLLPLVEGQAAVYFVGNAPLAESLFKEARLGVGTVENGEIGVGVPAVPVLHSLDFGGDGVSLLII